MPSCYLNTYHPMAGTKSGRDACQRDGIEPFVDGSIRREPDLEHPFPSISCLCRAGKFAPRLRVGDTVVYLTVKGRYCGIRIPHWRLTAVLKVERIFATHVDAARWYHSQDLPLPSNCMVPGNPPKALRQSNCKYRPVGCAKPNQQSWDNGYKKRAAANGTFIVCTPRFIDLSLSAPVVESRHWMRALGRIPPTLNPPSIPDAALQVLLHDLGVELQPSSP